MENYRYISRLDPDYPQKLQSIPDPPAGIYVKGSLPDPEKPSVAIIGSRVCSQYGRLAAKQFAAALALEGVQVISGLARGIDGIAQEAACLAGGRSFGILGCGVNVIYPVQNSNIYALVEKNGGLISEVEPDAPPLRQQFASRNRIISALCDVLLVVESRERSGTRITVQRALEQGKDIFAVPGRINDECSAGCNELILCGAGIATSPRAILEALGIYLPQSYSSGSSGPEKEGSILQGRSKNESLVLDCVDFYPTGMDELSRRTLLPVQKLAPLLTRLLMAGLIREEGKNMYIKLG